VLSCRGGPLRRWLPPLATALAACGGADEPEVRVDGRPRTFPPPFGVPGLTDATRLPRTSRSRPSELARAGQALALGAARASTGAASGRHGGGLDLWLRPAADATGRILTLPGLRVTLDPLPRVRVESDGLEPPLELWLEPRASSGPLADPC